MTNEMTIYLHVLAIVCLITFMVSITITEFKRRKAHKVRMEELKQSREQLVKEYWSKND